MRAQSANERAAARGRAASVAVAGMGVDKRDEGLDKLIPLAAAATGCGMTHPPKPLVASNSSFLRKRTGIGGGGSEGFGFNRREALRGCEGGLCGKGSGVGVGADEGSDFFPAGEGESRRDGVNPEPELLPALCRLLLTAGATRSNGRMTAWVVRRERGESPTPFERDADEARGTTLTASDARCSLSSSFGSSGETVDRVGASTATDAEEVVVGTERGGGGGGGAGSADVGVAGETSAEIVAVRRGRGLKISNSKDGERTRFRFVFDGAGFDFGVGVVVVVAAAGVLVEAREAATFAATSGTTPSSACGGDG